MEGPSFRILDCKGNEDRGATVACSDRVEPEVKRSSEPGRPVASDGGRSILVLTVMSTEYSAQSS